MKSFLLPAAPNDRARTFYGKAVVVEEENGGRLLLSYGVPGGGKKWWDALEVREVL